MIRRGVLLLLAGAAALSIGLSAQAEQVWFTVVGNPQDPNVNTIQVDPVPVELVADGRVMNIRVSRSSERKNWENVPYRSYTARVRFNCASETAVYVDGEFYDKPFWVGEPTTKTDYTKGPRRRMLFLDVEPNPTRRIVRAACPT